VPGEARRGGGLTVHPGQPHARLDDGVDGGCDGLGRHRGDGGHEMQGRLKHHAGRIAVQVDDPEPTGLGLRHPLAQQGQDQVVANRIPGQELGRFAEDPFRVNGLTDREGHRP
jgi:hypothetical protein